MHASGISAVIVLCKPVEAIVASLYLPSLNKQTAHVEDLQRVADSDQLVKIVRLARTVHLHKVAMCPNGQIITRNDQISYGFSRRSAQSSFIGSTGYKSQVSSPDSCEQNAQGNLP